MRHPFGIEIKDLSLSNVETIETLTDEQASQQVGGKKDVYTTLALGEEGGDWPPLTTLALGEEGGDCFF